MVDLFQEDRLDVPVIVEAVRHVELEARRVRQCHATAGVHGIDLLADAQRIRDGQHATSRYGTNRTPLLSLMQNPAVGCHSDGDSLVMLTRR